MNPRNTPLQTIGIAVFLTAETILYVLLLAPLGKLSIACSFASIAVCFLFALLQGKRENLWITLGLGGTVIADYFLVLFDPPHRLTGMIFFFLVQLLYTASLHGVRKKMAFLWIRPGLLAAAGAITPAVLGERTDALAVFAVLYYVLLLTNIAEAFSTKKSLLFAVGLVLFLLCDTVIGLQVASNGYLPIAKDSLLYRMLFPGFNLAWFFYLPAQVLIVLSGRKKIKP